MFELRFLTTGRDQQTGHSVAAYGVTPPAAAGRADGPVRQTQPHSAPSAAAAHTRAPAQTDPTSVIPLEDDALIDV